MDLWTQIELIPIAFHLNTLVSDKYFIGVYRRTIRKTTCILTMNKPYHFIGYWGLISQTEQEKFNNIIKNISTTSYKFQKQETWGILYLGVKQIPSSTNINQGLIASLSAGGIPNQSDAWVTVEKIV